MRIFRATPKPVPQVLTSIGVFSFLPDGYWLATGESDVGPVEIIVCDAVLRPDSVSAAAAFLADASARIRSALKFAQERTPWPSEYEPPEIVQVAICPEVLKREWGQTQGEIMRLDFGAESDKHPPLDLMVWICDGVPVKSEWRYV